mgnify:CR=1 FL=1
MDLVIKRVMSFIKQYGYEGQTRKISFGRR